MVVIGCRGGSEFLFFCPGILVAFGIIIRYFGRCQKRIVRHLEDFVSYQMVNRPLVLHLVSSGRNKAQGAASFGWDKQRDTC